MLSGTFVFNVHWQKLKRQYSTYRKKKPSPCTLVCILENSPVNCKRSSKETVTFQLHRQTPNADNNNSGCMATVTFSSLAVGQIFFRNCILASFYEDDMLPLLLRSLNIHWTTLTQEEMRLVKTKPVINRTCFRFLK